MTPPSPAARRLARPRWLETRVIVGVLLVLGSVLTGARVVDAADDRVGIVAVRVALRSGTQLSRIDLVTIRVAMSTASRARYVASMDRAVGLRLVRDIGAGELLARDALGTTASATTLSIPLTADAAPTLSPGQRVIIWASAPGCGTHVLLADATVQSVHDGQGGSFGDTGGQSIVVSVDPAVATLVVTALAVDHVSLHAGRIEGNDPVPAAPVFDVGACARAAP